MEHTTMRFGIRMTTLRSNHTLSTIRAKGHTNSIRAIILDIIGSSMEVTGATGITMTITTDPQKTVHTRREDSNCPRKETPRATNCTSTNRQKLAPKVQEMPKEDRLQ